MTDTDLDPIPPEEAVDWYLEHRYEEVRVATRRTHRSVLRIFLDWADDTGLKNLNALSGRDLLEFKTWRKDESESTR